MEMFERGPIPSANTSRDMQKHAFRDRAMKNYSQGHNRLANASPEQWLILVADVSPPETVHS